MENKLIGLLEKLNQYEIMRKELLVKYKNKNKGEAFHTRYDQIITRKALLLKQISLRGSIISVYQVTGTIRNGNGIIEDFRVLYSDVTEKEIEMLVQIKYGKKIQKLDIKAITLGQFISVPKK